MENTRFLQTNNRITSSRGNPSSWRTFSLRVRRYTNEGYEFAKNQLKSPLTESQIDTERAKELYVIYCGICHGNAGKGSRGN
jgi:mono/diheme cytochrome c family protein